jgi:hypothetical protein
VARVSGASAAGLSLRDGLDLSGLTAAQLWVLYVGVGGTAPASELAQQIAHDEEPGGRLEAYDHNVIAQALNEHFLDLRQDHVVGYRDVAEPTEDGIASRQVPRTGD